ncbi:nuclear transport factor 2 family protein [Streptomyces sp. NPDC127119]|uniref:nuclear transport factor 2 family protein n=1 Tax=Streptomyces sp. NPDC127119 TaxID=3345370 RepID=UPI00363E1816
MTAQHTIAVLGLGRMGEAVATRLAAQGRQVLGWTRSGRTSGSFDTTGDPHEAVAKADLVLLALFDGPACRQVLDTVQDSLRADTVVVNLGTIAPAEASELARRLGASYIHAPVLGSVPAVAAGALQLLTAAAPDTLDRARPVLEALGTVRRVGDASTAAALKLIANSSLAGAVLALRDALHQADALGLSRTQALDVLELGHLGGLVARKRSFLGSEPAADTASGTASASGTTTASAVGRADFTIEALAKDMDLLAAASGTPLRCMSGLADTPGGPEADIAVAATAPAVADSVLAPLRAYICGHATGDPGHFRAAFLPSAHIEGVRDGVFVSWPLDEYCALFDGRLAPDEPARSRRIDTVDVHGTVATATMTLRHGPDTFTDVFLLVRVDDRWRIANKAYHRHS